MFENTSIQTLLINDRTEILERWEQELTPPDFYTDYAINPLETLTRISSKHYDLILIDLGESSLNKRPYAIAHMIRDAKPGVILIGISGCPIIEHQTEPFDKIIIDSTSISPRLIEILKQNGF